MTSRICKPIRQTTLLLFAYAITALFLLPNLANALTVSPVRLELDADPGTTVTRTIKLTNEQDESKTFFVTFENFIAKGETGKPEFIGGDTGLATWINAPSQVTLAPNEQRKVPISLDIPADADPGGHFAAIFWGTTPPEAEGGGQVAIGGRLGILILLNVSGDVVEDSELIEFGADGGKSVFNALPITFIYRFENRGNVRIQPEGTIVVKNMLGAEIAELDANRAVSSALPNSIRRFEVVWGEDLLEGQLLTEESGYNLGDYWEDVRYQIGNFSVGRYTAELDVIYGQADTQVTDKFNFWILPWQLLSLVGGIMLIIIAVFVFAVRQYTKWVVRKAVGNRR